MFTIFLFFLLVGCALLIRYDIQAMRSRKRAIEAADKDESQ